MPNLRERLFEVLHCNAWRLSLATRVFIAHAAPGGKMEAFACKVAASGKPLLTLPSPANDNLVGLGAVVVDPARNLTELVPNGS